MTPGSIVEAMNPVRGNVVILVWDLQGAGMTRRDTSMGYQYQHPKGQHHAVTGARTQQSTVQGVTLYRRTIIAKE